MKKVLILGAGLVSRPYVNYLLTQKDFSVTVASRTVSKAEKLVAGHPNGKPVELNVTDDAMLEKLVSEHDLSVSLLPYTYHVKVAKLCIKHRKHMVTTSYVSDAMRELDEDARDADVLILNEVGVDPGIDHMSAMRIIDGVKENNGRILSFKSYCGGLPAPEANTNPWGYKFSWIRRGVVMAGKNAAKWLEDGKIIDVPGPELFAHHWEVEIPEFGKLEGYPNRNSVPYVDIYGIKNTKTMFRGTLRYPGWCAAMKKIVDLGFLDDEKEYDLAGLSYADFMKNFVDVKTHKTLKENLAAQWELPVDANPIYRVEWLGLLSHEKIGLEKELPWMCSVMHLMRS